MSPRQRTIKSHPLIDPSRKSLVHKLLDETLAGVKKMSPITIECNFVGPPEDPFTAVLEAANIGQILVLETPHKLLRYKLVEIKDRT